MPVFLVLYLDYLRIQGQKLGYMVYSAIFSGCCVSFPFFSLFVYLGGWRLYDVPVVKWHGIVLLLSTWYNVAVCRSLVTHLVSL